MSKRKYTYVKALEPENLHMREAGKSKREIAEYFGLTVEQVKKLLKRYHRKEPRFLLTSMAEDTICELIQSTV